MTFLFDNIIIGPIHSRRMGVSLGVNILPINGKLCNFDCIYCECGWNGNDSGASLRFNPMNDILNQLEDTLRSMSERGETMDVITFAGNGEPTTHPDFQEIINKTIVLRDKYFPKVKISILTNAALINKDSVRTALESVDIAMLKIDAVLEDKIKLINSPYASYSLIDVLDGIKKFKGEIVIQTMFLKGFKNGISVDNTGEKDVLAWLEIMKLIKPSRVVIYTIDRDTPLSTLSKVSTDELEDIGKRVESLGVICEVTK